MKRPISNLVLSLRGIGKPDFNPAVEHQTGKAGAKQEDLLFQ